MLTCDKCKKTIDKPIDQHFQTHLPYIYACGVWQVKGFDLCDECRDRLDDVVTRAKCAFINRKEEENDL